MSDKSNNAIVLGIDASRNRSGGAIAYLKGILSEFSVGSEIREVHIWASESLLQVLPNAPWLIKHTHHYLEKTILHQIIWQLIILRAELVRNSCDVLFSPDATSVCFFPKHVVLSQDLLSYESNISKMYSLGFAKIRLKIIKIIQNLAFKRALGVLFLTKYAADLIQEHCGKLKNIGFCPHGVDDIFIREPSVSKFPRSGDLINCIYISAADLYKNHSFVIKAIAQLRNIDCKLKLTIVGGGVGRGNDLLINAIKECDAYEWVDRFDFIKHSMLPNFLAKSDIFIFASSCENLPVTLLEGMAFSLPIACSNAGPMPEILLDGGIYFDPTNPDSISEAIHSLIIHDEKRLCYSMTSNLYSKSYTWSSCSNKTFKFIIDTHFNSTRK